MRNLYKIFLALCLLVTFVSVASAQQVNAQSAQDFMNRAQNSTALGTPDGVPPSGETVCNGLVGAAHGLCTAFCEAMDCDSGAPQASQKACDKVAANFLKITGQGLPCDCPCVGGLPGFIETLNGANGPLLSCLAVPDGDFSLVLVQTASGFWPASEFAPGFGGACGNINGGGALFITEQQGRACNNLIQQKAAAAGLTCVTAPI